MIGAGLAVAIVLSLAGQTAGAAPPAAEGRAVEAQPTSSATELVDAPEAFSLLGEPLFRPPLPAEVEAEREAQLTAERERYEKAPDDADVLIWLGRRLGYLGRYREAAAIFSRGIELHPQDARFLRHRGHRFLTLRRLTLARSDLRRAAEMVDGRPDEVEPDGLPNARGIPTSTLQSNIWYHLGLARYLDGDLNAAQAAYRQCMKVSTHPDMRVATSYWLYLTLRGLGQRSEAIRLLAPVRADWEVIENHAYHRLLLMFKGERTAAELLAEASGDTVSLDFATVGYGVGAWHLAEGREDEGMRIFRQVHAGGQWPAFGYLAAEAALARVGREAETLPFGTLSP